nr:unnamed protein product [Callosobruchus chinensis]
MQSREGQFYSSVTQS